MWYTVAHCESSDGMRFFRLDRVEDVQSLDARFESPRGSSVEEIVREGSAFQATAQARSAAILGQDRALDRRAGREDAGGGRHAHVEHPLADTDWAVRHVLQYGPDVDVLAPASVREAVVARLSAMAAS